MAPHVLLGGISHETNTFVPDLVDRHSFQERGEHHGDEIPDALAGTETAVGGAIAVAEEAAVTVTYSTVASATPGGIVAAEAFEYYADRICDVVSDRVDNLDGIILPLHGAMVTEDYPDGEGELIHRVREIAGADIPIVVTLDLHGNVSDRMVELADALVAYETYPHLDKAETGRRGMALLLAAIDGEVTPDVRYERPPMIIYQPEAYTGDGPMAEAMAAARQYEADDDDVLTVNVMPGFYHADVDHMGVTVSVVTDEAPERGRTVAQKLAGTLWEMRDRFVGEYPTPSVAVDRAERLRGDLDPVDGPIVLADFGSNPGGGGAADGTTILREFIDRGLGNAGWAIMYEPEVVDRSVSAGVGNRVITDIGGKSDDRHGAPIADVDGYVKAVTDGQYVNTGTSHSGRGVENDIGRTVRFECGESDGVTVVCAERRASAFDAEIWRHVGCPPERFDYLCVPSLIAFRGDYEPFASEIVLVDTPGLSAVNPGRFDYEQIPRPIYPLDDLPDDAYPPNR